MPTCKICNQEVSLYREDKHYSEHLNFDPDHYYVDCRYCGEKLHIKLQYLQHFKEDISSTIKKCVHDVSSNSLSDDDY